MAFHGTYREIQAPNRVVSTEVFEGFPDAEYVSTVTLVDENGKTSFTNRIRHKSKDYRDGHLNSGMEPEMQQTFDRLEELLASMT